MAVVPFSMLEPGFLSPFPDLRSVPPHRHLRLNLFTEMLRRAIPFDYISIGGLDLEGFEFGRGRSIDSDMPPLMLEAYFKEGLFREDPLTFLTKQSGVVTTEEEAYDLSPPPQRVMDLMKRFGIRNRTIFPISRPGRLYGCIAFARSDRFSDDEIRFLSFMAQPLHTAMTRPLMERFAAQENNLSQGEILCLHYASNGLTSEDIAARSGYQLMTVNSYIKAVVKKLRVANRTEAVAEAIRRGLID